MQETFSIVPVIAIALGLFYAAGGIIHMRSLALEAMTDRLLAMLGDGDAEIERRRTLVMTIGAALTFASGLSLMMLSRWTLPFFACNAVLQGGYLLWAARAFPPEDEAELRGRRATIRAFLLWLAALGFVIVLEWVGAWRVWRESPLPELAVIAAATLATAVYFRFGLRPEASLAAAPASQWPDAGALPDPESAPLPERLRLQPEIHCTGLWDDERSTPVDPADLGLGEELAVRIEMWNAQFQVAFEDEDAVRPRFRDVEAERAWVAAGRAIAEDLAREWSGPLVVRLSALDELVRDARHDLAPWQATPDVRVAWIGERCGVAEIGEAIARIEELARERDALPQWDGDSQDDIAQAQEMYANVLSTVAACYLPDVAAGLASGQWGARAYVAMALSRHDRTIVTPILRVALAREADATARSLMAMWLARLDGEGG